MCVPFCSGMLQNTKKLDREKTASYSFVVAVKDGKTDKVWTGLFDGVIQANMFAVALFCVYKFR